MAQVVDPYARKPRELRSLIERIADVIFRDVSEYPLVVLSMRDVVDVIANLVAQELRDRYLADALLRLGRRAERRARSG